MTDQAVPDAGVHPSVQHLSVAPVDEVTGEIVCPDCGARSPLPATPPQQPLRTHAHDCTARGGVSVVHALDANQQANAYRNYGFGRWSDNPHDATASS